MRQQCLDKWRRRSVKIALRLFIGCRAARTFEPSLNVKQMLDLADAHHAPNWRVAHLIHDNGSGESSPRRLIMSCWPSLVSLSRTTFENRESSLLVIPIF